MHMFLQNGFAADVSTVRLQGAFNWDAEAQEVLHNTFGLQAFRPLQREIINCTLSGRHCLSLLPSGGASLSLGGVLYPVSNADAAQIDGAGGVIQEQVQQLLIHSASTNKVGSGLAGGKRLCYQLPALVAPKPPGTKGAAVTLVISPLLSLIQVRGQQSSCLCDLWMHCEDSSFPKFKMIASVVMGSQDSDRILQCCRFSGSDAWPSSAGHPRPSEHRADSVNCISWM